VFHLAKKVMDQGIEVGETAAYSCANLFEAEAPARLAVRGRLEPHAQHMRPVAW